jgi:hypothetical protein
VVSFITLTDFAHTRESVDTVDVDDFATIWRNERVVVDGAKVA